MSKTALTTQTIEQKYMNKVFSWMGVALLITAATSFYVLTSKSLQSMLFGNPIILIVLMIAEFAMVASLAAAINKMSLQTANLVFVGYSILNGLTLSGLALVYTGASIASAFLVSALTFTAMAIYGSTTKSDLTELGKLAFMGLIGIIIASVVNIFMHSSAMEMIISYIGVAVFIGLTAYDTQKIKAMVSDLSLDEETAKKYAILGALTLYLDFINLFIMILRIVGVRNNRDF